MNLRDKLKDILAEQLEGSANALPITITKPASEDLGTFGKLCEAVGADTTKVLSVKIFDHHGNVGLFFEIEGDDDGQTVVINRQGVDILDLSIDPDISEAAKPVFEFFRNEETVPTVVYIRDKKTEDEREQAILKAALPCFDVAGFDESRINRVDVAWSGTHFELLAHVFIEESLLVYRISFSGEALKELIGEVEVAE